MERFENFDELKKKKTHIADRLLKEKGNGTYKNYQILYFDNLEDFVDYHLWGYGGEYYNIISGPELQNRINPLDYIDIEKFGYKLLEVWTDTTYKIGECIVETKAFWD